MNENYTWAWILWLLLFIGIEGAALLNKDKGDTLSEHVWKWFSVKDASSTKKTLRMLALGGFMGWLFLHFMSGGMV